MTCTALLVGERDIIYYIGERVRVSERVRQTASVYINNNNNNNYYINYQRRVNWSAIGGGRCSHAQTHISTELWRRRHTVSSHFILLSLSCSIFLFPSLSSCLSLVVAFRSPSETILKWRRRWRKRKSNYRNGPPSSILLRTHDGLRVYIIFIICIWYALSIDIQGDGLNMRCIIAVQRASAMSIICLHFLRAGALELCW